MKFYYIWVNVRENCNLTVAVHVNTAYNVQKHTINKNKYDIVLKS